MDPEPDSPETLLAVLREIQAHFKDRVEDLRAEGIDLGPLLEDCERMAATLEGRSAEPLDVKEFTARFKALVEEVKVSRHLQQQAEAVKTITSMPGIVSEVEAQVANLRAHGGSVELRTAADLEASAARLRTALAAGTMDYHALADLKLTVVTQLAELDRRDNFWKAKRGLYWERWPPERWATLSPEERLELEGMLEHWRQEREKVLGALPLEDRRRLEAASYEDFDRPGACDP